jgi:phospholipid transport system substrate-binding protein
MTDPKLIEQIKSLVITALVVFTLCWQNTFASKSAEDGVKDLGGARQSEHDGTNIASKSPEEVVRDTTRHLLTAIRSEHEVIARNPGRLYELVEKILLPVIDSKRVARWILGRHGRYATAEQLNRFTRELQTLLIYTYSGPLLEFTEIEITYLPLEGKPDARDTTVRTRVLYEGKDPLSVHYHLHFKDGRWQIYDVTVEGISAIVTLRSTFADEIRKLGLEGFIEKLARHNKRLVNGEGA